VKPMLVILSAALPVLVSVTVWAELVVPTPWAPKAMVVGLSKTPVSVRKPATRFAAFTVPIPVAKSHPVVAPNAG